ncbi:membrane fusion protein, multidrug efflux system/membrane fusion protein, multidrug efflux system [Neorhodopirellula lusitana]|uniref:Membrane fusion protein, multidrug efflux system/membrane fusion protein, multidrug efflux system n=1 Tax=Neorhodopirellula lusitana TaxID=445327 RepID=A0ABY1PPA8_9BACT|nr:efflux RND transporter periplasmic adaptor subunit [Neorhodopirellula lusitana]SMP38228.1 membrane fusion protein, multidrug efflux system/membrane fusion protein, multidrug efflux system [Neorhodopirellula lusitana]
MRSEHFQVSLLCIGLSLILASGCSKTKPSENPSARPTQKVSVAAAVQNEVTDYIELVGRLAADEKVVIQSRVSGFLLKTHFTDGQRVQAGDLLFTIEPDEYDAIYNQAQAQISVAETQLELARKKFARSQKLLTNDAISREEFDEDQAAVAEAAASVIAKQADSARVKLDVDYTKIISPISGRVDRALLDDGNFVTGGLVGGTVLTTVLKDRPIKAIANINEGVRLTFMRRRRELGGEEFQEADKLQELNIPCFLQLQDETDFPHEGKLEYAESQVNEQTGTSQIRAMFENASGLLTTGMFVRLKVPVSDAHSAVLVPDTAIGTDQATKFVYVVDDQNEVQHRTVEVGDRKGKLRVILSGVKPSESVVVAGIQLIQPGMKVDPVSESP